MAKYYNCMWHRGSGGCTHPERSNSRKGGPKSAMCHYTPETERKCHEYRPENPHYSHSKGGKK